MSVHRIKTGKGKVGSQPARHSDVEMDTFESTFMEQPASSGSGGRDRRGEGQGRWMGNATCVV